ncbi:MAG: flagellar biosynthesis protein FlgL [Novosphingobium sp.]
MTTVTTSAFYERSTRALETLRARAESLQTAIGSGQRLSRGSDDPVAAAQLRGLSRAQDFAQIDSTATIRASADLALTDATLGDFAAYVTRVKDLTVQAASGTLTPAQRAGIGVEIAQVHGELLRLANSRDSAGHALFGGETSGNAYVPDAVGNPVYAGTASPGELSLGEGQNVTRGLTGPQFLNFTGPGGATDLFTLVRTLGDALQGGVADPAQAARDALGQLDAGLDSITTAQTVVGSRLNWIDLVTERRTQRGEQRTDQQNAIGGADPAEMLSALKQTMAVLEASQASFVRLSGLSLFALLR